MNQVTPQPPTQVEIKPTQESLGKLNDKEIQLLDFLRKRWRFGEVTILMRDGIPYRVVRAFESKDFE